MTDLIWPAQLPAPNRDGYQTQWLDQRRRRAAASVGGYRGRFSQSASVIALVLDVTRSQREVFARFAEDATQNATLPFRMPDPTTSGWPLLDSNGHAIVSHAGQPILMARHWLCLFGEELPVETLIGIRFRIAFSVLVLP